jgi:hypothetical protein
MTIPISKTTKPESKTKLRGTRQQEHYGTSGRKRICTLHHYKFGEEKTTQSTKTIDFFRIWRSNLSTIVSAVFCFSPKHPKIGKPKSPNQHTLAHESISLAHR